MGKSKTLEVTFPENFEEVLQEVVRPKGIDLIEEDFRRNHAEGFDNLLKYSGHLVPPQKRGGGITPDLLPYLVVSGTSAAAYYGWCWGEDFLLYCLNPLSMKGILDLGWCRWTQTLCNDSQNYTVDPTSGWRYTSKKQTVLDLLMLEIDEKPVLESLLFLKNEGTLNRYLDWAKEHGAPEKRIAHFLEAMEDEELMMYI